MSDAVPVVWIAEGGHPDPASARSLAAWARARGVVLGSVGDPASAPIQVDFATGDRIEHELDRARDAIAAFDADAADRALARAEALLRMHPELPHAAWLRAEVERAWSTRLARLEPRDEARAANAWRRAAALDGGRLAGVGELERPAGESARVRIVVEGAASGGRVVRVDGTEITTATRQGDDSLYDADLAPAEHHLVVYEDSRPVFASWISVVEGSVREAGAAAGGHVTVRVPLSPGSSCSGAATASVARRGDTVTAAGVTCPRWIAAVPDPRTGNVRVAQCAEGRCGPLLEWRAERIGPVQAPQGLDDRSRPWPAWATVFVVGVGVVAAGTVALVSSGVLEDRPVEQRFVAGGARVE